MKIANQPAQVCIFQSSCDLSSLFFPFACTILFCLFYCLYICLHAFLFLFVSGSFLHKPVCLSPKHNNNTLVSKPPSKTPSWSQAQLKEAISCILTQQMRFTQASAKFKIPKGTLYDNILGKTKRSRMLDEIGLSSEQERAVLEFACDIVLMPYNRRTSRPLIAIVNFVKSIKQTASSTKENPPFEFPIRKAFKWWWAFCKKYSVISLYFKEKSQNANVPVFEAEERLQEAAKTPTSPPEERPQQMYVPPTSVPLPPGGHHQLPAYPHFFYYPSPYLYALSEMSSRPSQIGHVK